MERFTYASIIFISLACIFGGTAQAQIFIDQWGKTSQGKAWPIHWNESYPAGDAGIGNGARPASWATIRGGFETVTLTTDKSITVSGKMELVGGSGTSAYTWLRYALTYQADSTLNYRGTDSAIWISTQKHYGYEFTPRTGTGTMTNGTGGSGTVWTVSDGNWNSTWSNNGKPISAIDQTPYDAVAEAGMYNWAISVRSINDTLNEIKWYLNEINNKYCIGETIIDTATTKKFNGICFGFNNDIEATNINFYEVKVDFDEPNIIPPVPWQAHYVEQWGRTMQGTNRPILNDSTTIIGNAGLGTPQPLNAWATIRGGFNEPVSIEADGEAMIISGKLEYVGGASLGYGLIPLRYALTFQDSADLLCQHTDSAIWISTKGHSGYEFAPGPQSFSSDLNTVYTVKDNIQWNSTYSNNGIALAAQVPRYAKIIEGVYDWAVSIEAKSNGTNEVRWYLTEINNKYWWGGCAIDTAQVSTKFNGICFGFADGVNTDLTQFNLIGVKVEKGAAITVPEPPFESFYIDKWGKTSQGKAWPIIWNDSTTLAGDAGIGNGVSPTGWATIRGGFDPVTITTDSAIIVSGKMEFIGGGGDNAYTWLRYALTHQDSSTLMYRGTDSAEWVGSQKHNGYAFMPRTGTGITANGNGGAGTVWTVFDGNWISTLSNGGKGPIAAVKQAPRNAVAIAGIYNWAISVRSINDTLNEIKWYLIEQNNKYWFGGTVLEVSTSKTFNGVNFGFNSDIKAMQVKFTEVKVDLGDELINHPHPSSYYISQWGIIGNRFGGWKFIPADLDGNVSIGGDSANTSCAAVCGCWDESVTLRKGYKLYVTGKVEFIHGGFEAANSLRIGIFNNSTTGMLVTSPIDSTHWTGSENTHSGYLFVPPSGYNTLPNWNLLNQQGTWGAVVNDYWFSTGGSNNYPLGSILQVPAHASGLAGKYNFAFAIAPLTDTTNEVSFSFAKEDDSYSFTVENVIDQHYPLVTQVFNGIAFALDSGNSTTGFNLYDVLIEEKSYAVGVKFPELQHPAAFQLYQNYPNPFNPRTVISYKLKVKSEVRLMIYDILGREIVTLVNEVKDAGVYAVEWNGRNSAGQQVGSGIYFYRLSANGYSETKKLVLIK